MDKNILRSWLKEVVTSSSIAADADSITITTRQAPKPSLSSLSRDKTKLDLFSYLMRIKPALSAILLLLLCVSAAFVSGQAHAIDRKYHKVKIADIASDNPAHWKFAHTHIEVEGWVTYVLHEADGDWHIRLCDDVKIKTMDRKHCVVVEVIPTLQPSKVFIIPHIGSHLRVRGITRYDAENSMHNWWEVHPAESIEVLA